MPPPTRADCEYGPRPCPRYACRHHLWNDRRVLKQDALPRDSCSLDVAKEGGATLERVGFVFGLTRERIRQIEAMAIKKLETRGVHLHIFY